MGTEAQPVTAGELSVAQPGQGVLREVWRTITRAFSLSQMPGRDTGEAKIADAQKASAENEGEFSLIGG